MGLKTSLILTINNRTEDACRAVADSFLLSGNLPDQVVMVLDRAEPEVALRATEQFAKIPCPITAPEIEGPPGWLCPARAWNAGFKAATGDLFYCISSEVVQDAGNVERVKNILAAHGRPAALFGACHNSEKTQIVVGAEPGLLVSSVMPRPLGFIVAMPAKNVRQIGGFDEAFMGGFWFDDDSFFYELWQTGLDFIFDDSVHGVHQHHERASLTQEGIQKNAAVMMKKYGRTSLWNDLMRLNLYEDGRTTWGHI